MYGGGGSLGGCPANGRRGGRGGETGSAILESDGGGLADEVVVSTDFPRVQDIGS